MSFGIEHKKVRSERKTIIFSVTAHLGLLFALTHSFHAGRRVAPYRLPGTAQGVRSLTYFSAGDAGPRSPAVQTGKMLKQMPVPIPTPMVKAPEPASDADQGSGISVKSGLGQGDISIALQKYFPYPQPDLSALPRGTSGDVILNAVIDEHGRITELTLIQGLGSPIDQNVIATVQQWSYTPATKDGVPVTSEQELHFHYQRG